MRKHVEESVATGAAAGRGRGGRFSAGRKREVVMRLLRGEDLESVSRAVGITAARASHWRAQFLAAGQAGLKSRATDARDGDGVLLTVRTSKTNQEGDAADVRYLKHGPAKAIRTLRAAAADAAPTDRVVGLSPLQIQRRFTAAARAAGIEARVTAHSGRVGSRPN